MKRIKIWMGKIEKYYPPGYEYQWELAVTAGLTLIAVCISMYFFIRLGKAFIGLSYYDPVSAARLLRPDAAIEPFHIITGGIWQIFWLPALSQGAIAVSHYCYYYRDTRSIYLMRRLPERGLLIRSCLVAPLLCLGMLVLVMAVLWLLYLGCYFLAVPAQCLPSL